MDATVDKGLRLAIAKRRIVRFLYKGYTRVAEPHDYGVTGGRIRLLSYQIGGQSSSNPALGWRWVNPDDISEFEILDQTFPGPRPAPSGQHTEWDELYASVSRPATRSKK